MFHGFNLIVPKEDTFLHSHQYESSGNDYFKEQKENECLDYHSKL